MTAKKALAFAASRIGYYAPSDMKPGSEAGRWMAEKTGEQWLAGPSTSVWWCMCFASMCTYEAGGSLPGGVSYNTDFTVDAARRERRLVPVSEAQPGDLAIFDWNRATAATDHVGIVEERLGDGRLVCIEGNTSSGAAGSQHAGNGVWRRVRSPHLVRYVVRPYWTSETKAEPETTTRLDEDGIFGPLSTFKMQQQLVTPTDSEIWGQSQWWRQRLYAVTSITSWDESGSTVVTELQRRLGVDADGIIGPATIRTLQERLGVDADGWFGQATARALQAALNRGDVAAW